ncbi:MAG: VCBS repeat-containing protein [Cecembia sp.]
MKMKPRGGKIIFLSILVVLTLFSPAYVPNKNKLFESIPTKRSGINFNNKLTESRKSNILTYEYFYNGGGIAIGDINNDGLEDIFFTGNMVDNKLYLNKGDFKFEDISKSAGVTGKNSWTTGVAMVDINGDGFLDIYVCYSGNGDIESRRNQLFINQGDLTFKEAAKDYGLDDPSNSTQALFFDFDNDGDLDLFLLNHHIEVINELEFDQARKIRHPFAGDKLFRNDNGKFTDISEEAGIKGNALGFGLGVIASDINGDGFLDIFVSNDYIEPDYLYINNGDGTFTDRMPEMMQHISHFSMGLDIADINNDGLVDIFTLDMLPEDNKRQKLLYGPENYEQYALMINRGFFHQNMRNMLHLNQGNGSFSEIGQLAGVSNTDWSWSSLFFDINNNGHKDLFVSNGYYRDYTNRDFLKFKGDYYFKAAVAREKADTLFVVTSMSSTPIPNYLFENNGNLKFENVSSSWGVDIPGFSNGAAFADLNNDGQLDLVVNNINSPASVYRNRWNEGTGKKPHWIQIQLKGERQNSTGIGAKVEIYHNGQYQMAEQMPTRGFQSTVPHKIYFGLGDHKNIDSLTVSWPGGNTQVLKNIATNQLITIHESDAKSTSRQVQEVQPLFTAAKEVIPFQHKEYGFNDFKRQPLLTEMPSYIGPVMAYGDINGNGTEEIFIGGTKDTPGKIFVWNNEQWVLHSGYRPESEYTDAGAVFADFNGDGHLDLFVASGGYHDYTSTDEFLQDRLYLNDGNGKLIHAPDQLPRLRSSASSVVTADFNGDGIPDLFIGGRIIPGRYPTTPQSYLLINDGKGTFKDESEKYLPNNGKIGMVTAAVSTDLNKDGKSDLIIVGEFMPITILINDGHVRFSDETSTWGNPDQVGWWRSIAAGDFNNDGHEDFIVGNFGWNSQLKATNDSPLSLYFADFDGNSSIDPILVHYVQGKPYPFASRDELLDQMYSMRSKFTDYASYANASLEQVLTKDQLKMASILRANEMGSFFLKNSGDKLESSILPIEAQFAPVQAIYPLDYDGDGNLDFILAGNQSQIRIRLGVMDANQGQLFRGDGNGNFTYINQQRSGFKIEGDVKSIIQFPSFPEEIHFGINGVGIKTYQRNK